MILQQTLSPGKFGADNFIVVRVSKHRLERTSIRVIGRYGPYCRRTVLWEAFSSNIRS